MKDRGVVPFKDGKKKRGGGKTSAHLLEKLVRKKKRRPKAGGRKGCQQEADCKAQETGREQRQKANHPYPDKNSQLSEQGLCRKRSRPYRKL